MRITPLDIYQQEFKRVLRGVDPDEVEDFLERVADDYEEITKENAALKKRIKSLETRLADAGTRGRGDAERSAEAETSNIIREAKKEADNVIREARKEADNIIRKAKDEARERNTGWAGEIPEEVFRRQVDSLLEEAKTKASKLLEKPKMEEVETRHAVSLRREISKLRGQKERFLIEYRELLEKHLKILTESEAGE